MKIDLIWNGAPPNEDIAEIEENISKEIAHLGQMNSGFPSALVITLAVGAACHSIDGVGVTHDGKTAVTFTYPLLGDRKTTYLYHP